MLGALYWYIFLYYKTFAHTWWPPRQRFTKTLVEVSKHRNIVFMLIVKIDQSMKRHCYLYVNIERSVKFHNVFHVE